MCCLILPIKWINKEAGEWCVHCDIGNGCRVFGNGLPDECAVFICAYNQVNCDPALRPDRCKVIFEKVNDDIFLGTMHPRYNESYKKKIVEGQIKAFLKKGISVVINSFTLEKPLIFPASGKKSSVVWLNLQAVWEEKQEKYGSPIIHN